MSLFRFFARVYNLYFSADKQLAHRVRDLVGFAPAKLGLFRRAFAHKSGSGAGGNNERLEYLGDAVLGTIVAEYLFKKYPRADEGFLTKMRSKIVKRKSLNYIGEEMGLAVVLRDRNRMRLSSSMLGNAVEALVGAVYLESGYARTERFVIRRMLRPYLDMDALESTDDNYKSQLLEACQKQGKSISYDLVKKFKQERRDRFKVAVMIGGEEVAVADDFNKKAAEQLASRRALEKMGLADNLVVPRRKEKRSRAAKRAVRETGGPGEVASAIAEGGAIIVRDKGGRVETKDSRPEGVRAKGPKPERKRRRSPYDYLIKHAVRTGVGGAAALAAVTGEWTGVLAGAVSSERRPPASLGQRDGAFAKTSTPALREVVLTAVAGTRLVETAASAKTAAPPTAVPAATVPPPSPHPLLRHLIADGAAGVASVPQPDAIPLVTHLP